MLVNFAHQSLLNIHQSNCDAYSTHAALLNIDLQWHNGRPTSCRVSWKSCVVFLEVEVEAKTIQPFDLSDAALTELWWVSLRQTRTQKHLYTHNKTTQWTLLSTARSSILYLMLSLAVFLRINNATTLYVPKALCCCFHHSFSKGALSFSGNTITKTACLASLMRGFLPLGSVVFLPFFSFSQVWILQHRV